MNGGAIRATLIGFKLNNTNKMRNPTLVTRKTDSALIKEFGVHFFEYAPQKCAELL